MSFGEPNLYAPRVAARLYVPAVGEPQARVAQEQSDEVFQLDLRPHKVRITNNNHNEADECEVTFSYDDAGIDPRFLRSGELYVWLYDENKFEGDFLQQFQNQRFVGIVRDVARDFSDSGKYISITALDYTTLFLEMTSYPSSGVPQFSDTLTTAWQRVCDNTGHWNLDDNSLVSSVSNLRDRLQFEGDIDQSVTLGAAVPERVRRLGQLQLHSAGDAWAVWQTCVQTLGLISFIRGDRCVVTTASDFYTADDPPRFIWGQNVKTLKEARDLGTLSNKLVAVRSFDPLAGKTLESLYPNPSNPHAVKKKKLGASASKKAPKTIHVQDYECFDLPFAVGRQEILDVIAERIWEERTRQELHGTLSTVEMDVDTVTGSNIFDLTKLAAGDQIQVEIDRDALDDIQSLDSIDQRINVLVARGYGQDVAKFIASNLDPITRLLPQFLVHSATIELDTAGSPAQGGSYEMTIDFVNRIDITGSAANDADGKNLPPMEDQSSRA